MNLKQKTVINSSHNEMYKNESIVVQSSEFRNNELELVQQAIHRLTNSRII